jgi:hypothetical protein
MSSSAEIARRPATESASQFATMSPAEDPESVAAVFYQVGEKKTIVSGRTIHLRDVLPKLGGKWDSAARVWRMPAARTAELVAACEEKQILVADVGADKSKELELS